MAQTMLFKEESPLLDTAILKLRPGVFSHPVWIRFGDRERSVPLSTIRALFNEADNLKQQNPGDACQVLFICAAFQQYSGYTDKALETLSEVQALAERASLDQEILWALWGACAICVQQNSFDKAAEYLSSLKQLLSDQNDWVLAGYVDVVKQTLTQKMNTNNMLPMEYRQNKSLGNVLNYTFQWLNQWGFSAEAQKSESPSNENHEQTQPKKLPLLSSRGWRSLQLFFKGELKVHWLDDNSQRGKKRSSFWGYLLSLFHIEVDTQEQTSDLVSIDTEIMDPEPVIVSPQQAEVASVVAEEPKVSQAVMGVPLSISVQMLGDFSLTIQDTPLNLSSSRSLSLLKYLLLYHRQNTPREVLLDTFWPDVSPDKGRNNLNVAMNGIRTSLRTITDHRVILYKDNAYGIAPDIHFWVDVEEFERLVNSGRVLEARNRLSSAISDYEAAISLYQGDFLEENPYENWTVLTRERLRLAYLATLDSLSHIYFKQQQYAMCITLSQLILTRDRCREDAHSMLMRCYSRQGQDHLALRQYQACVEALRQELDVTPTPETTRLNELIRQHKHV